MQVSYGGIAFQVVKTNSFAREPVLTEDRTELLFMRTTYDLTMIFNPDATSFVGDGNGFIGTQGALPALTDVAIRYHLMKPRQQFILANDDLNASPVLVAPAPGSDRDPDHGPRPVSCSVDQLTPKTWRVSWRVVVASIECGPQGALISNRYAQAQTTGMDKLTRVTTRGVSRFRADALANQNTNADVFRSTCIPGLPLGFQRQAVNVQVSPDGLTLLWQVEDQEMFTSIGATNDPNRGTVERFEASFAMRTMGPDAAAIPGAYLMGRFHGSALGSKASSRSAMFAWLARLAIERMALPNGVVNPAMQPTVMAVSYHEDIHQPYVTLDIDVKFPPSIQGKQGLAVMRVDFLGVDIIKMFSNDGQNPQMPGDNNTRGTANVLAFAAAIKEACSSVPALPYQSSGSRGSAADNYTASTVDVQVTAYGDLPDASTSYSPDVQRGTYTEMSVQSTWRTAQGNMQVPIAGKPPQQGYSYTPGGSGSGVTTSSTDDPTTDCEVITLSRPCTELTVTFEAERSNVPPIIPNANSTDANLVLLHETISPLAVSLDTDGVSPVYRIGGSFTYAAKSARKAGAAINFGVAPFTTYSYSDTMAQLGPDSMANGIVDPPGDPAGVA